jgi:hypothetical protein
MLKIILCSFVVFTSINVQASEEHKDNHKEEHREHDDHQNEEKQDGFKLTQVSLKTFDIKTIKYVPQKTLISRDAVYKGLNEVNIYRVRAGLFKRIDFKILSQTKSYYLISSADLKAGDELVVNGIGFLRMAEIAATGGLENSHSH